MLPGRALRRLWRMSISVLPSLFHFATTSSPNAMLITQSLRLFVTCGVQPEDKKTKNKTQRVLVKQVV